MPNMRWPTPQDYNEAVQNPALNFSDEELKGGTPELNALGLPKAMTGAFASVYRIRCDDRDWAVRCFLHNIEDQKDRYEELSKYICGDDLVYTVGFQYLHQGLKIGADWFPILKMEWVEGQSLDQFLGNRIRDNYQIERVLDRFKRMAELLGKAGIAHGDLQHGNILVLDDDLRLVDYDGMFVPGLTGYRSNELGHPNYQHPRRTPKHFGPFLDNFAEWVIYTSLFALTRDPELWGRVGGGDECLLFRQSDFRDPGGSQSFALLENHPYPEIRNLGGILRTLIDYPLKQVPKLDPGIKTRDDLPTPDKTVEDPDDFVPEESDATAGKSMRLARFTNLPEWMLVSLQVPSTGAPTRVVGPWPQFRHYQEAIRHCSDCFLDPELSHGSLITHEFGMGTNGVVFHVHCATGRHIAVKCFFKYVEDRQSRYEEILKAIAGPAHRYFIEFEYLPEGIKVGNYWYPILKMEWRRGISLEQVASFYQSDKYKLLQVLDRFRLMMNGLQEAGIAHGDLHPRNMIYMNDDFKLVDYDNLYVPAFEGMKALELGHQNYRHPGQTFQDFGPNFHNYSAWVIDTMIMFMSLDYDMWELANKKLEYTGEGGSWAFKYLDLWSPFPEVRERAHLLDTFRQGDPNKVPPLNVDLFQEKKPSGVFTTLAKLFAPRGKQSDSESEKLDGK